jgi:hypothetical protein
MDNPSFQALLRRGVEWAATGRVTPAARLRRELKRFAGKPAETK